MTAAGRRRQRPMMSLGHVNWSGWEAAAPDRIHLELQRAGARHARLADQANDHGLEPWDNRTGAGPGPRRRAGPLYVSACTLATRRWRMRAGLSGATFAPCTTFALPFGSSGSFIVELT